MAKWKSRIRKQQKVCQVCGCSDMNKLEVHHVLPRSLYSEHKGNDANLVCLCSDCHAYLHDVIQPLRGLAHNECDFISLVMLYAHRGNKSKWNKKTFIRDVLAKAKVGYYDNNLI